VSLGDESREEEDKGQHNQQLHGACLSEAAQVIPCPGEDVDRRGELIERPFTLWIAGEEVLEEERGGSCQCEYKRRGDCPPSGMPETQPEKAAR